MSSPVDTVRAAAKAEAKAETSRAKADAAWRAAWWKTTMALAAVPAKPQSALKEAFDAAIAEGVGQSRDHLSRRRRAGQALQSFAAARETLSPTMVLDAMDRGIEITAELVTAIQQAEINGIGSREFITELTGQPRRPMPEGMTIEQQDAVVRTVATRRPEVIARTVEDLPAVAKAVAASPVVRREVDAADRETGDWIRADEKAKRERPDPPFIMRTELLIVLEEVKPLAAKAVALMRDGTIEHAAPEMRDEVISAFQKFSDQFHLAADLGRNGVTVTDAGLDRLLNG